MPRRAGVAARAFASGAAALPAAGAAVAVGGLGAANGGYFPVNWGWAAFSIAAVAALTLALRRSVALSRLELAWLAAVVFLALWTALSSTWSDSVPSTVLEVERSLVYIAVVIAGLLAVRRDSLGPLLGGIWAGVSLVAGYGLLTRLFPESLGLHAIAGYRLSEPLGYWNALGIFCALGALLALGLATRGRSTALRAVASASLVVLLPTLYFTFSRGAWIALAVGLVTMVAVDPRRLSLLATLPALVAAPALAVALGARSSALTRLDAQPAQALADGRRLGVALLALGIAAAGLAVGLARVQRRVSVRERTQRRISQALVVAIVAGALALFATYGSPPTLVKRGYDAFNAPPPSVTGNLNERLINLSGSGRMLGWRIAWRGFEQHPVLGSGAGTYEQYWMRHRTVPGKIRDAHSLYLETLAELGPLGLALLAAALALPLAGAVLARAHPLVPAALGAYAAYLLHTAADWDWEMPAITTAALLCGCALVAAARHTDRSQPRARVLVLGATIVVAAAALLGLLGNLALDRSRDAARDGRWNDAASAARSAQRYAPWSAEPWRRLGLAQETGRKARGHLRTAIDKDPRNWQLWLEYAWATKGRTRAGALARAGALNPLSPELAEFRSNLRQKKTL